MRDEYDRRRKFMVKAFNDMGLHCFEPKGAFYAFPCIESTGLTSEEFCERLLYEEGVAIVRRLSAELDDAERKIKILQQNAQGEIVAVDFVTEEDV